MLLILTSLNILGNGENARYHLGSFRVGIVKYRVKQIPNNKILELSKLKAFVDDITVTHK